MERKEMATGRDLLKRLNKLSQKDLDKPFFLIVIDENMNSTTGYSEKTIILHRAKDHLQIGAQTDSFWRAAKERIENT